ncbi:hypothetical protein [Erythrobacter aureus]|uniref:Uncharacterized protein n=1 Tax=Erythrobacter aureus TaxID=2182384 RepID=A0A345YIS6_9SPHN|nr:hypothetical protein [Erythrobacter aureus]AXK43828.1 hypothetical protein DVR09_15340 [Erythrobacter aureus]
MSEVLINDERLVSIERRLQQLEGRQKDADPAQKAGLGRSIAKLKAQANILRTNPGLDLPIVEVASLHDALATMDLPVEKKTALGEGSLRWLGRNMALHNAGHPRLDEARGILGRLGVSFVL